MKRITAGVFGGLGIFLLIASGDAVSALQVSQPNGEVVNGWYKDRFSVDVKYGHPRCNKVAGNSHSATFNAGGEYEGAHSYKFLSDQVDNPYVSVDGGSARTLVNPLTCANDNPSFSVASDLGVIRLDVLPPSASITSPGSSTSTSSSSVTISGTVNDSASGVARVQAIVNGQAGPTAQISGSVFSITVNLQNGNNTIEVIAYDNVGHSKASNTIAITKNTSSPTSPTNNTPSSNTVQPNSSQSPDKTPIKFNQEDILSINGGAAEAADEESVLVEQGLAGAQGKTYYSLLLLVIALFGVATYIAWRFLPIFKKLDKSNSGLRKRIVLIVALPSLIPLFGLGFLGYQQLTTIVTRSLSEQLTKAAQVSSLKLEREFAVRNTIITRTGDGILQVKSQIQARKDRLDQQKNTCSDVVRNLIPRRQYSQVTSNDACLPFLSGFAQVSGSGVADYLNAVTAGYDHALKTADAEEQQRINELLGTARHFFPELTELVVVNNADIPKVEAILPASDKDATSLVTTHANLLIQSKEASLSVLDADTKPHQLLITYPITNNEQKIVGGTVAKYNLDDKRFIPGIWLATPKPSASDLVFFINSEGKIIYPTNDVKISQDSLQKLAKNPSSKTANLTMDKQPLVARVSPVKSTNWYVVVASPKSLVLAPLAGIQRTALLAIAVFILLSILLGLIFVTGIAKEIERLLAGALAFAKGKLDYRIDLTSHDELQVLGDTMNKMAEEIKTAQEALIEKDKEFISIATHELRTPLTAIVGSLSMINDGMGKVDDTAKKFVDQAFASTVQLREIVNDMLDIARYESGREEFKLEPLDIQEITKPILEMQAITAKNNAVALENTTTGPLPKVIADPKKLKIIISNFVSNAIKYNRPNGVITIAHKLEGETLVTSIADTGLGIPKDQQVHIFEKFYRVDNIDRGSIQGTGLGLHITKQYIEAMGGKVWFESQHGKGTTFSFSLPVEK